MLKKLRNKMLILNMASTLCLILISFAVIYSITYSSVEKEINQSLFRAFTMHRPPDGAMHLPDWQPPDDNNGDSRGDNSAQKKRMLRDTRNFSVFVKNDGTIETNSMFGENNELYTSVASEVLKQSGERGRFRYDGIYWCYQTKKNDDGTRIIALADITAENGIIVRLLASFALCSVGLLVAVFLISLYFANKSIKPVRDAWDKQKQFVADASHELKTPLAAINTNVDVLLGSPESTVGQQSKWLEHIKSEAERLTGLVQNLLFMARIDGDVQVPMTETNLSDVYESVALNMEAVAFEKGKNYSYDIEHGIYAKANAEQLTRLCLILVDNAVKYSPDGGHVDICLKRVQKEAVLSVSNDGDPIPPEEQKKIFDRFYCSDKARTGNSYGLGLAMAKDIAAVHHGKLTVESRENEPTRFAFSVPWTSHES